MQQLDKSLRHHCGHHELVVDSPAEVNDMRIRVANAFLDLQDAHLLQRLGQTLISLDFDADAFEKSVRPNNGQRGLIAGGNRYLFYEQCQPNLLYLPRRIRWL